MGGLPMNVLAHQSLNCPTFITCPAGLRRGKCSAAPMRGGTGTGCLAPVTSTTVPRMVRPLGWQLTQPVLRKIFLPRATASFTLASRFGVEREGGCVMVDSLLLVRAPPPAGEVDGLTMRGFFFVLAQAFFGAQGF